LPLSRAEIRREADGEMKQFSFRDFLVVVVAQLCVIPGCMERFRAADKQVEAIDNRMKQIEKDATNVHSKRDAEPPESRDE
jgi:hypothetical protein